ncbi:MAG: hypothetical protein WCP55_09335 [Lentisphaerota bacterium]
MSGKGDTPRPMRVSLEEYNANYDLAFGKKTEEVDKAELKEESETENTDKQ